jgi:uncharacterized protein
MRRPSVSEVIDTTEQRRQLINAIGEEPHLVGSACSDCATQTFPAQTGCPRCGSNAVSEVALPRAGSVWTWTVQRFPPKAPYIAESPYEPFALAYVDLGPVKVESRLRGRAIDAWKIGDAVQVVIDAAVTPLSFWFEPIKEIN